MRSISDRGLMMLGYAISCKLLTVSCLRREIVRSLLENCSLGGSGPSLSEGYSRHQSRMSLSADWACGTHDLIG